MIKDDLLGVEPVAWRVRRRDAPKYWTVFHHKPIAALQDPEQEVQPLYAEPQSTQENTEYIGFYSGRFNGHDLVSLTTNIPIGSKLYTHLQPKRNVATPREWVGLIPEEVVECQQGNIYHFYRCIEDKLKEKNT